MNINFLLGFLHFYPSFPLLLQDLLWNFFESYKLSTSSKLTVVIGRRSLTYPTRSQVPIKLSSYFQTWLQLPIPSKVQLSRSWRCLWTMLKCIFLNQIKLLWNKIRFAPKCLHLHFLNFKAYRFFSDSYYLFSFNSIFIVSSFLNPRLWDWISQLLTIQSLHVLESYVMFDGRCISSIVVIVTSWRFLDLEPSTHLSSPFLKKWTQDTNSPRHHPFLLMDFDCISFHTSTMTSSLKPDFWSLLKNYFIGLFSTHVRTDLLQSSHCKLEETMIDGYIRSLGTVGHSVVCRLSWSVLWLNH